MYKLRFYRSSANLINNSLINFVAAILVLLITFNLGWFIAFIGLYTRLKMIGNLNKILFNLESILLLGNLGIVILLIAYVSSIKSLRSILGKQ